jgi:DNA processing protein
VQDTVPYPAPTSPPSPATSTLADWVRLAHAPGVGGVTAHKLLKRFATPQAIFAAGQAALARVAGADQAAALCAPMPDSARRELDGIALWLAVADGAERVLITLDDPAYPRLLAQTACAPLYLYVQGRSRLLYGPALAVVGARNATRQGVANAEAFGRAISAAGVTVVSGLALGIDAAAHRGALDGRGGTLAVLGTGIDRIYPRANEALARRIAREGCLVSEYPLGAAALSGNFPRRNRIISGLANGVLVVEAALKSGSLITAALAVEQNRDVFAIPGSIHAPLARGCHQLIRDGARLVETAADLVGALALPQGMLAAAPLSAGQAALLAAIGHAPVDCDVLAAAAGIDAGALAAQLLLLELGGHVERLPGGMYQRLASGLPD